MDGSPRVRVLAALAVAAIGAAGCATPYVVDLPGKKTVLGTQSIEEALTYLDQTREAFRTAVVGQIKDEHAASNIFIGTGALIAAMALGKVHRDGILGATALAGTGYALTTNNLPRTRLQIHLEAVKALNCTERAALPLAMSDAERAKLSAAVAALRLGRQQLLLALEQARVARAAVPAADQFIKVLEAVEPGAVAMLEQTATSVRVGEDFLDASARAAARIVGSVTEIRDTTIYAIGTTATPLTSVEPLVQALSKDFRAFAPGADIDALLAESKQKKVATGVSQSPVGSQSALESALDRLDVAAQNASQLQYVVNSALRGRGTSFAEDAFKDCNVAQVLTALSATPTPLRFAAAGGGQRILELSGGVKPYFLRLDGESVPGLSFPNGPIRGGEAEITYKAGAAAAGMKSGLRLSDSSAAGQGVRIEVEITGAAAAPAMPAVPAAPAAPASAPAKPPSGIAATPPGIDSVLAALKKRSKFRSGGVDFERQDIPVKDGDRIRFTVLCPADNTRVFQQAALAKSYLADAGVTGFPADKIALSTVPPSCAPS